ncbi:hypothetical protein [Calditerrivibrio nitroreducens]|uniref:hypothetical protein n=1 Tax=Calditerrivibrio TaxID=545865 RepID=UPI003C70BB30
MAKTKGQEPVENQNLQMIDESIASYHIFRKLRVKKDVKMLLCAYAIGYSFFRSIEG